MLSIRLIVTDLDNTIYNWLDFYIPSFLAMVKKLSEITRVPEDALKASFKRVHEKYHTSEYTFAIQQLDILEEHHRGRSTREILEEYGPALYEFRKARKTRLRLYEGVRETLLALRESGKLVAALTDSKMFQAAVQRLRILEVEDLYHGIVAPPDHGFPPGTSPEDVRYFKDPESYTSKIPIQLELDPSIRKPNPKVLMVLLERFEVEAKEAVYIGDSLFRDVLLAQRCGVHDVLAQYGRQCEAGHYEELLKLTYLSSAEIAEEKARRPGIIPSFEVGRFPELLSVVEELEHRS